MITPQKSDAGLAFSLPSKVTDQEAECDAPPDTGATETPGPERKRTAEELWGALVQDAMEEEIGSGDRTRPRGNRIGTARGGVRRRPAAG
jgi:hypothetical protein